MDLLCAVGRSVDLTALVLWIRSGELRPAKPVIPIVSAARNAGIRMDSIDVNAVEAAK